MAEIRFGHGCNKGVGRLTVMSASCLPVRFIHLPERDFPCVLPIFCPLIAKIETGGSGMSVLTLQDRIDEAGDPLEMLRTAPSGPYQFPIKAEFSNWRDEQEAWRQGAVLFDQSFHMTDLYIEGPDTRRLCEFLAVNSMANWRRDIAKQFVHCTEDGYLVRDAIIFILEEERANNLNKPMNANWVMY
ncbi:MAG: hypothetical protein F4186_15025, partial [Boseongicola sp. SB0676_bin_33]|nr:hypothetical protein [Boseongicola sp. SB0676_bin_33]